MDMSLHKPQITHIKLLQKNIEKNMKNFVKIYQESDKIKVSTNSE